MAYSTTTLPPQQHVIYHIYSRGAGNDKIFRQEPDYLRFLKVMGEKLCPVSEIYAYCLIPNHYHLMLKVTAEPILFSRAIGEMGVSYAKWYNKKYGRMGPLFMSPYKRKQLHDYSYLAWIPWYIHRNPLRHGLTLDWENYKWSSYPTYMGDGPTRLTRGFLLNLYGGREAMQQHHRANASLWLGDDLEG